MKVDILSLLNKIVLDISYSHYESVESYKKDLDALSSLIWKIKTLKEEE